MSRGSHAGHVPLDRILRQVQSRYGPAMRPRYRARLPGRGLRERPTTSDGLRLVPLERLRRDGYRRLGQDVSPPWEKEVYRDPESPHS